MPSLLSRRLQAGMAYARRGGGVADCMLYDVPASSNTLGVSTTMARSPEPERYTRGKAELPSHVLGPTYKFGAPTKWASTAKEVMSPMSSPAGSTAGDAAPVARASHRVRGGHRSQGSDDSWWSSAGVDPAKTVFGKPTSKKDSGALAEALGAGQKPTF